VRFEIDLPYLRAHRNSANLLQSHQCRIDQWGVGPTRAHEGRYITGESLLVRWRPGP